MGTEIGVRNISKDVFAKSNGFPPHIPISPPLSTKERWESKVTLVAGFWDFA